MAINDYSQEFFNAYFTRKGKSRAEIARALGESENSLRSWLRRGRFPKSVLEKLAHMLDIEVKDCLKQGVTFVRETEDPVRAYKLRPADVNLLPLLKLLVTTDISVLTLPQIRALAELQCQLREPMSAVIAKEYLEKI